MSKLPRRAIGMIAAAERPGGEDHEHSPAVVPLGLYFFWPVLAWLPIGLLLTPSTTEDFA